MRVLPLVFVATLFAVAAPGYGDENGADRLAARVAPYLDEFTVAVLHADVSKVDVQSLLAALPAEVKGPIFDPMWRQFEEGLEKLKRAGLHELYAVFSLADSPAAGRQVGPQMVGIMTATDLNRRGPGRRDPVFLVIPLGPNAQPAEIAKAFDKNAVVDKPPVNDNVLAARVKGRMLVIGRRGTLDRLESLQPVPWPELAKALTAVEPADVRVALLPPRSFKRVVSEMQMPETEIFGPDWGKTLGRGFVWAAAGVRFSNQSLGATLVIQSEDAGAASQLQNLFKQAANLVAQSSFGSESLRKSISSLVPEVREDRLIVQIDREHLTLQKLFDLLSEPVNDARQAGRAQTRLNSIKQFAVAMHNYYDVHKRLPASCTYDANGKPLLSWRVQILPYLGEAALYKRFHLDEPWDSEHNKQLIALMPAIYGDPGQAEKGTTTCYQVPVAEGTLFDAKEGRTFKEVVDGTVHTIMLVAVKRELAAPWTKPQDWQLKPQDPTRGLADYNGQFLIAFADGSVRGIKMSTDKETIRRLFIRNDRMPVTLER